MRTVLSLLLCCTISASLFSQQQTINVGTNPNDGTGDTLRAAFQKTNANFTDLYTNKQTVDSDLTAIGALSPSNDDVIQRKAGAWTNRTMAQLSTDLQTPLNSVYQGLDSDLTAIAGLSATNDDFLQRKSGAWTNRTVAQVQADLGIDSATLRTYYAIDNGITTGGTGAANTAALQTLINTVNSAGGGVIQFDYGTYNFNYTGTSPWAAFSANRYCVQLKSGVYLRGMGRVNGTKLKLGNTQMAGTTNGVHLFTAGDGCDGFGLLDMELDGNAAGQSGWTDGYAQGPDHSSAFTAEPADVGVPNIYNARFENLYLHGWFSAAIANAECQFGTMNRIKVDDCGEGILLTRCLDISCWDFEYDNTNTVSVGDGFESSGGANVSLNGFVINDCSGGVGIDMATAGFIIANGIIRRGSGGVTIQNEGATSSLDSPVGSMSNVYVEDCVGIGISVSGGDDDDGMDVQVSGCKVSGCTRGYVISKASDAVYSKGYCRLDSCHAEGNTQQGFDCGLASVVITGGSANNNTENGIILRPATNSSRDQTKYYISDVMCINNGGFGITCETAANVPRLQISAYCEGNAAALTFADKYCQISVPFPSATDIFVQNLRPIQTAAWNGTNAMRVCGERTVRIVSGPLGELNNGSNGQIVTLFADTNPITIYDKTSAEGVAYYGNGPCNLNCFDATNIVMAVGESVSFLYRASTGEWYQVASSAGRDTLSLSPVALADNGVLITANPPGSAATTAWVYDSTGDRAQLSSSMRNVRASGTVYDRKWTNAGDAYTSATDGTSTFAWGLDNSASQWKVSASGTLGTTDAIATDASATATHTRFFLYDVDKGAMQRVLVGAADSGGTGYKMLRVVN